MEDLNNGFSKNESEQHWNKLLNITSATIFASSNDNDRDSVIRFPSHRTAEIILDNTNGFLFEDN